MGESKGATTKAVMARPKSNPGQRKWSLGKACPFTRTSEASAAIQAAQKTKRESQKPEWTTIPNPGTIFPKRWPRFRTPTLKTRKKRSNTQEVFLKVRRENPQIKRPRAGSPMKKVETQ